MGILTQHITQPPTPPSEMAARNGRICPHELEAIILKAIQKNPPDRYQTMGELVNALIEFYRFAVGPGATTAMPWAGASYGTLSSSYPSPQYQHAAQTGRQTGREEKKGKGALVAAIIGAVVVVGGGGVAWVVLSPSQPVVVKTGGADAGSGTHV